MTKLFSDWTVLPHEELVEVDDNLITVAGMPTMPFVDTPRRMSIARMNDRRLVLFNAIALHEDELLLLESYGDPTYLIVPGDDHRLDARAWKHRYPRMAVVSPPSAKAGVERALHVDATEITFDDPNVDYQTVPGTNGHEAALLVRTSTGLSIVLNDLVDRINAASTYSRLPEPTQPKDGRLALITDPKSLHEQLLIWAGLPRLMRIFLPRGRAIDDNPQGMLRQLAAFLKTIHC